MNDSTELSGIKYTCKLGVLSRPDGSAIFCLGDTTIMAGVYGPVEVKMQKVLIDKASVECFYRPKTGASGIGDRLYEHVIRNICETALVASLHPRSAILVNIQELHNHGYLVSCAINAACLACLDAGIDMKCMFAAVTCFLTEEDDLILLPSINEKYIIKANFIFVFDNCEGNILATHTEGSFSKEHFEEALNLCREESSNIFNFYSQALLSHKRR